MYWTLSEIRGLEAGGGWRGWWRLQRTVLAGDRLEAGICSQQTSSCSSLHSGRILNTETIRPILHPFPLLTSFSIIITFYLSFFCINLKGFPSKSLIFCEVISWCGIALVATSDRGEMELDPLFSSGHLPLPGCWGHTYIVHNQFGTFLPRAVLHCFLFRNECHTFTLLWWDVITSDYQWLPDQHRNSVTCDQTWDSQHMNSQMSR